MAKEKPQGLICPKGFRWSFKQGDCVRKRRGLRKGHLGVKRTKPERGERDKKRWDPDSCACKDKLISDAEFKKDSTAFAAGKYDHSKYPVNLNLPKNKQPAQTQEFFDRYTRKK